jgi:outer membrane protein assembly factor BamB
MPDMFISYARRRPRRFIAIAGVLVLVMAGAAVAVYFEFVKKPGNVSNPNAAFETTPKAPPKPRPKPETFKWPIYGYTPDRSRFLDVNLRPPFRELWKFSGGRGLIEFQPVLANGVLYYVNNGATAFAVNAKTGRMYWSHDVGSLVASSPAWSGGRVYITTLSPGAIVALDAKTGKAVWRRSLPSRSESSPIVVRGVVYFGSEDGTVYAYRASDGSKVWTYHAGGAVKAGLALSKGKLYFGDYSGAVTALRVKDGSRVWSTSTNGATFNRSGQFYATPAVAFGRVYLGNTDSFVYSFVAATGQLAWRHATGSYVYSAAAVGDVPRLGPTVYVGSYDGNFYALDARSGNVRWSHHDGGRISGAPTVVGSLVYYSSLGHHDSSGLDVRTGSRVWHWPGGAFNPVISDGLRIYLTTSSKVLGLIPKPSRPTAAKPKPRPAKQKPKRRQPAKKRH